MDLYNKKFVPMLLSETNKPFNNPEYIFEIKFDGIRALIYAEPSKIKIINRRGNNLTHLFPELDDIKKLVKYPCVFDGEIVLMEKGKPSFSGLQERILLKNELRINFFKENNPVTFVAFDLLYDSKDITHMTLLNRKKHLEKYKDSDVFVKTKYIKELGIDLFNAAKKQSLEGIVAKKIDSSYQINIRTSDWIKIKNFQNEILYIGGYKENEGAMASLVLGRKVNNKLYYVGRVTIGKKNLDYKKIVSEKTLYKSSFHDFDKNDYIYIKPKLKCNVLFTEKTKHNSLRHPIYDGLR